MLWVTDFMSLAQGAGTNLGSTNISAIRVALLITGRGQGIFAV